MDMGGSRGKPERFPLAVVSALCGFLFLGGTARAFENVASQKELPEGAGLAAAFAADAGIGRHEAVIFADGFEEGELGSGWDETGNKNGRVLSYADPGDARLGRRCLRVEAHLGEDTGGGVTRWFESSPALFIRFYTKFDAACDYIHHFVTLRANRGLHGKDKWSGFGQAGLKPEGRDRFSTAIEPWGDWGRNPPPGRWNFYSYWHEMAVSPDGKYWGNLFSAEKTEPVPKDQWICVEFMLKHNTPGVPDGEQAYWINGALQGHWKGINWRKSGELLANALTVESYITDSWTKHPVNIVYFDNTVIARRYVGPAGESPSSQGHE
jgi:hypothetical protein